MVEVIKVDDCGSNIGDYDIPIHNAIIIPEGATIGDMIKAMFPNCEVSIHEYMGIKCGVDVKIYFSENESFTAWFPSCLWYAPYKKEVEE